MTKKKIAAIVAALLALLGAIKTAVDALPDDVPVHEHAAAPVDGGAP